MQSQTQHQPNNALIGSLMVLAAAVTVSSKAIIVKLAYAYPVDAATLIALRMAFSAPFFIALAIWASVSSNTPTINKKDAWKIFGLGVVGGYGPMWLDFAGLAYVTAGLERIILFLYPTIVVILSAILYKHKIGKREIFALVASYAGVSLVVGHDVSLAKSGASGTMLGAALVTASAIVYAAYLVFSGRVIPRVGSTSFTAYTMLAATLASGLHFVSTAHQVSVLHLPAQVYWLCLLMAVVATVLPAVLLNAGIHRLGSNKASLVSSIGPVSTIFLAYIFLGEDITWLQLAGTGLVLMGVLVISMKK
ncbi:MAG TPA: DMT family transporter [Methylotenera sp.]|nr:DMT family transporter [Methylotenera sp.]